MIETITKKINYLIPESILFDSIEYDAEEKFVIIKSLKYLKIHLKRYFIINDAMIGILCWTLGTDSVFICGFLLNFLNRKFKSKFTYKLRNCSSISEDYPDILLDIMKKIPSQILKKFRTFLDDLISSKIKKLEDGDISDIEKNIKQIKKMFNLSDLEIELLTFLFIIEVYDKTDSFFNSHLRCKEYSGKKYLCNILKTKQSKLNTLFNGTLNKIGAINFAAYGGNEVELEHEFLIWFQNPNKDMLTQKLYSQLPKGSVPLNNFFIENSAKKHILRLLKDKPSTSTHLLFYGPPGSGKTSFACSIVKELEVPSYEIFKPDDNTSIERQAAVIACLNMTNTGSGSIIVIDEADNILNTKMSWFMRGETQDKGWLNQLLDKPGSRIIWITNHIENIETSVLRRFAYSIHFKTFNRQQRIKLWENILCKNKCRNFVNEQEIIHLSKKYQISAGAVDIAVNKAVEVKAKTKNNFLESIELTLEAHQTLMNNGDFLIDKEQIEKKYSLDGLNIKADLKKIMKQLKKFDQYLRNSHEKNICNMNLLFYGPPGTGKSEFSRYIVNQLDRQIICKRASDIQSCWVGESEKNIKKSFEEAERENAVLIIDEADTLLFKRERAQHSWEISFTNEFLTQMERFQGILICTTNQVKELDSASIRRFSHKIGFNYLNPKGNIIFYKKMLCPLLKTDLDKKHENSLRSIEHLAPGDFKTVRNNFSFYSSKDLKHELLILALRSEVKFKKVTHENQKIGF